MLRWAPLFVLFVVREVCGSCATKEFMPCVVQLNTQKVPFDTNIMHVIYNITTEAKLIHTCRAYERAFPCFAQRIASCGTKAQRSMLDKGKRIHPYLCAPFSLQRQKIFLKSSQCIQSVLKLPMDSKCEKPESLMTQKLRSCRSKCGDDHICNTKVDISEVAACSYLKIERDCGVEAAQFYAQMQQVITNREFPVQCAYTLQGTTKNIYTTTPASIEITTIRSQLSTARTVSMMRKKTTPYYFSTSYITVYPEGFIRHNGVSRKEMQQQRVRTRNFSKLFTAMKSPDLSTLPGATIVSNSAASLTSLATRAFSFTMSTTSPPILSVSGASTTSSTTASTLQLPGARPIPETTVYVPGMGSSSTTANQHFPIKVQLSLPPSPGTEKFIPWYHNNKESGSAPSNPMMAPFMDVTPYPTLIPSLLSNDFPDGPPIIEPTPSPFKININWLDGPEGSLWYQQAMPQQRKSENQNNSAFQVVTPLLNHLKSQQLNFTEMSHQASNYFNAALSALESVADESRSPTSDNNPWRTFIDAVAPTIHKVSPNIIPRIRQEMERIESQGA